MILHENPLPADVSHEISCIIRYFLKSVKILNCRLLQNIGGALRLKLSKSLNISLTEMIEYFLTEMYFSMNALLKETTSVTMNIFRKKIFSF